MPGYLGPFHPEAVETVHRLYCNNIGAYNVDTFRELQTLLSKVSGEQELLTFDPVTRDGYTWFCSITFTIDDERNCFLFPKRTGDDDHCAPHVAQYVREDTDDEDQLATLNFDGPAAKFLRIFSQPLLHL